MQPHQKRARHPSERCVVESRRLDCVVVVVVVVVVTPSECCVYRDDRHKRLLSSLPYCYYYC